MSLESGEKEDDHGSLSVQTENRLHVGEDERESCRGERRRGRGQVKAVHRQCHSHSSTTTSVDRGKGLPVEHLVDDEKIGRVKKWYDLNQRLQREWESLDLEL